MTAVTNQNQCPQCKSPVHFDGFRMACTKCGARQPIVNTDPRQCQRCGSSLHLSGNTMKCSQCGLPHPEHPISIKSREHAEAQRAKPSTVPFIAPATLAVPADPRTVALEKAIDALSTPTHKKK